MNWKEFEDRLAAIEAAHEFERMTPFWIAFARSLINAAVSS